VVTATVSGVITPAGFSLSNLWWYVAPTGNEGNNCLSPGQACATINGALNKPDFLPGDTILVATGTYTSSGNEVVLVNKNVSLSGGWNSAFTAQTGLVTIDGQKSRRGITIGATAIIENFNVENGFVDGWGGGIVNGGVLTPVGRAHNTICNYFPPCPTNLATYRPRPSSSCSHTAARYPSKFATLAPDTKISRVHGQTGLTR